jgi:hypothetical protein
MYFCLKGEGPHMIEDHGRRSTAHAIRWDTSSLINVSHHRNTRVQLYFMDLLHIFDQILNLVLNLVQYKYIYYYMYYSCSTARSRSTAAVLIRILPIIRITGAVHVPRYNST